MRPLLLIIILLISSSLFAQNSISDVLDLTTFHYEKDGDGDYIIKYRTRSAREQLVVVRSNTNSFHGVEVREIISIAKRYTTKIPDNLLKILLIDNYSEKYLGNWSIDVNGEISTILFIVKLPFDANYKFLEAAIIETAEAADALEKALEDKK